MSDYGAACPTCGTPAEELSSEAGIDVLLMAKIPGVPEWMANTGYEGLLDTEPNDYFNRAGRAFIVVHIEREAPNSYGEFYQGYEGDGYIIFQETGYGIFYRKDFRQDSYGHVHFSHGNLKKVIGKTKTITTWE
jgi:hypothetical protein